MKKFSASKIKREGQVFTPDYLVSNMLDYCGYLGNNIIGKHIIDNSCGDGAFLCEIVKRYCNVCVSNGIDKIQIKETCKIIFMGSNWILLLIKMYRKSE